MYEPQTQKGLFANGVAWILGGFALVLVLVGISWGVGWVAAPFHGKLQARQQINSGSFRIAAYNHFFDLCAAIQSDDARLDAQLVQLPTAKGDDVSRIETNIAGITSDRADAINQYNADASKSYTIGQFKSSHLPYQIPLVPHMKGVSITCAVQ